MEMIGKSRTSSAEILRKNEDSSVENDSSDGDGLVSKFFFKEED